MAKRHLALTRKMVVLEILPQKMSKLHMYKSQLM